MEQPWLYAVWIRVGDEWKFSIHPGTSDGMELASAAPSVVYVSAIDRCGNESKRVTAKAAR